MRSPESSAISIGRVQYERDAPLDKSGLKQIYSDVLATYRIKTKKIGPSGGASL